MTEAAPSPADDVLLVASPEAWRDVCFSLPAVRALAAAGREVTILCPEHQAAFWVAAGFTRLCCHPDDAAPRRIAPLLGEFETALLWEAGPRAEACTRARIPSRTGTSSPGLEKCLTSTLDWRPDPGPPSHAVQRFLETARLLGADPMHAAHFEPIPVAEPARAERVLVIPGSPFGPNHEWPLDRWAQVVEGLILGGRTVMIGVAAGDAAGRTLATATERERLELDPSNPLALASFGLCLAADGPLPHLAAAFGVPCAMLFGPGDPIRHRPLGRRHRILRRKVECSPCFLDHCPLDLRCQHELEPEAVLNAALQLQLSGS